MTWMPGQPVVTANDDAEWRAWRKARKLEQQRYYRKTSRRIDYYPSKEAQAVIDKYDNVHSFVIDELIRIAASHLPEGGDSGSTI